MVASIKYFFVYAESNSVKFSNSRIKNMTPFSKQLGKPPTKIAHVNIPQNVTTPFE